MCWRFFKYKLVLDDNRNKLKRDNAFMEAAIRDLKSIEPPFTTRKSHPRASTSTNTTLITSPSYNTHNLPCLGQFNIKLKRQWTFMEAAICDSTSMEPPPSTSAPVHISTLPADDYHDLPRPGDSAFAFDYDHSSKLDHVAIYRPGSGIVQILKNDNGTFGSVYPKSIAGYDESGDELDSPGSQIVQVPLQTPVDSTDQPASSGSHLNVPPRCRKILNDFGLRKHVFEGADHSDHHIFHSALLI
jgi:hypothetical protein